jgi:hypothetical protein
MMIGNKFSTTIASVVGLGLGPLMLSVFVAE